MKTIWPILPFIIFACASVKDNTFSFVQICDTQLGFGEYQRDIRNFEQAAKQINNLEVDFAVICGDLVNTASDTAYLEFNRVRNTFTMPCHVAPGNHDVGNDPDSVSLAYYRSRVGKDYYMFRHKGRAFYLLNTQLWKAPVSGVSEKQDEWLVKCITDEQYLENHKFIIGHIPLFVEDPQEEEGYYSLPTEKRAELLQLFSETNVKAILTGHTHKLVVNEYDGMVMVSGETTSKNFDKRPYGFRVWTVSEDSVSHAFVALEMAK